MHPFDSWPHNREQCYGKLSDLTAGFVCEKVSHVFGLELIPKQEP